MTFPPSPSTSRVVSRLLPNVARSRPSYVAKRTLFNILRKKKSQPPNEKLKLTEDNLFHPFSKSPFEAVRQRGEAIKQLAPCPVCTSAHKDDHAHVQSQPKAVRFECPDCGFPTHCSEEHWKEDEEHKKYCSRLREVNEDEHDLRSGREIWEFKMPGPQDSEAALSFANWDLFWYTRGFRSIDTERSKRHLSKLLTYPLTIGSVLHQYSGLTLNNGRLTSEGNRSLAALRSGLHVPIGAPDTEEVGVGKPDMRIFILGARAESSLPPHVWEQLAMLFPSARIHLHFIGPQVSLPRPPGEDTLLKTAVNPSEGTSAEQNGSPPASDTAKEATSAPEPSMATLQGGNSDSLSDGTPRNTEAKSSDNAIEPAKPAYVPNVYEPPTPDPIMRLKRTRSSIEVYGVPSYTAPYTPGLTITGMQTSYMDVHAQFQETYDPYTDVFFLFSPGFGFPSPTAPPTESGEPTLQIAADEEWGPVLPALLATRCAIFVTGFSPTDVERDIQSLSTAPHVANEFDWVITPGPNAFGSEKWEVADFDPRVMVKTNWGIWGIRAKSREIRDERAF